MKKSIYDLICDAITEEGKLADDFKLPDEQPEYDMKFAPGAWDGIVFYHGGSNGKEVEEKELQQLLQAIQAVSSGNTEKANQLVHDFSLKGVMLPNIDNVQHFIIDHQNDLDSANIIDFAVDLVLKATRKEAVKFGLSLLELFDTNQIEKLKVAIRTLALSDEFTLFCAFIMCDWDNASKELFEAAKQVNSWGRIHIMRMIEPDSIEIEDWMVLHGVENDVLPAYSSVDCYNKTHFIDRLQSPLSLEMYRGLAGILDALLDEVPVEGLSSIAEQKTVIDLFIKVTKDRNDLEAEDFEVLLNLMRYVKDVENRCTEFIDGLDKYLKSEKNIQTVYTALEQGKGLSVAKRMGLNYQPYAYKAVLKDCLENAWWASLLIEDDYHADEILNLLCDNIDLDSIATGSDKKSWLGKDYTKDGAIDFTLQAIRGKVGLGIPLVKAALLSPVIRHRNGALAVLEAWTKKVNKSLKEMFPEIHDYLQEIVGKEIDNEVSQSMRSLL